MPASHHSVFTCRMPFLLPNQQCQSTKATKWPLIVQQKSWTDHDSKWHLQLTMVICGGVSTLQWVQHRLTEVALVHAAELIAAAALTEVSAWCSDAACTTYTYNITLWSLCTAWHGKAVQVAVPVTSPHSLETNTTPVMLTYRLISPGYTQIGTNPTWDRSDLDQ